MNTMSMCSHLQTGQYGPKHVFSKYTWIGFSDMVYKHNRLSINRSVIQNSKHWRIPVIDPKCLKDPGGTILRYRDAWYPGQKRFHTMPLTYKQMLSAELRDGRKFCTVETGQWVKQRLLGSLKKVQDN